MFSRRSEGHQGSIARVVVGHSSRDASEKAHFPSADAYYSGEDLGWNLEYDQLVEWASWRPEGYLFRVVSFKPEKAS